MASTAYYQWINAGRPYHLILPAATLQSALQRHGLTVYDNPDNAHLTATVPEDHTPYSVTGWPGANARWNARALDVMPRGDDTAARVESANIARQLIKDRDAGVPGVMWIKYINWTDEHGVCRQERWTDVAHPNARTTHSSTDNGHIHISGRSDVDTDTRAAGYDPIARMNGVIEMGFPYLASVAGAVVVTDGITCRWVTGTEAAEMIALYGQPKPTAHVETVGILVGKAPVFDPPKPWPGLIATLPPAPVTPTDEQWAALTADITETITTLFATKGGQAAEDGAEAAIRKVLGSLDGATPPAAAPV